jgi:hypothetical protein
MKTMNKIDFKQELKHLYNPSTKTATVVVEAARTQVAGKKNLPALPRLRLESLHEGQAAQIMHLGPYAAEAPTIQKLHDFIAGQGWQRVGKHHEIYLNDPGRTAPEKLKTIIRQPFE